MLGFEIPPDWLNFGTGVDLSIRELAELVASPVRYTSRLTFTPANPDGTPRNVLDVSRLKALGWKARISLDQGIRQTYDAFRQELARSRLRSI